MGIVFKIAWRNIFRHKGKSFVIGGIIFLGAFLLTIGNGVIAGMETGFQKNVINGFIGDLVIVADKQKDDGVLFSNGMSGQVAKLPNYPQIKKILENSSLIERHLPVGKNVAMALNEQGGDPGYAWLLGVDIENYKKMFPGNYSILEGKDLKQGESGVIVGSGGRKEFYNYTGIWAIPEGEKLNPKNLTDEAKKEIKTLKTNDNFVFMGFNEDNSSSDIRVPVKGVIKYSSLNNVWGNFIILDIESYRKAMGYFAVEDKVELKGETKKLMESEISDDDLFGGSTDTVEVVNVETPPVQEQPAEQNKTASSTVVAANVEDGVYNMVFVKLKKGVKAEAAVAELNKEFEKNGLGGKVLLKKDKNKPSGARAITWRQALGQVGDMMAIIKVALVTFVVIMFAVAIIIIVNTLTMAALERISEIGMMRAVGAKKRFISHMFFNETAVLSFFFGGLGILSGITGVFILRALKISSDNEYAQVLFGGDVFSPVLHFGDVLLCVILLLIVTLIAVIYPIKVARRITPLDAISRD